jgi:hypothetical protein
MSESISGLERDIEETRTRIHDTIDQIQSKLTLTGVVDEVIGTANAAPQLDGAMNTILSIARRHPIPVLLIAAGTGWLIHRMSRRTLPYHDDGPELIEALPVVSTGQSRVYDPDMTARYPSAEGFESRRTTEIQA